MSETSQRPNIIWIFGDQQRAQALGCNGDPNARTPNIDVLAEQGVNYTQAISGFPLCCPARGSILTGCYPHKVIPGHEYPMPDDSKTVAHAFAEHGYNTAWFGKWHVDGFEQHGNNKRSVHHTVPPERRGGFHTWLGYDNNNSQYDCWLHGHDASGERSHWRLPGYETDDLTDILLDHLETRQDQEQPFFAALSVQPPHDPYVAPPDFAANYNAASLKLRPNVPAIPRLESRARRELAGYYGMIENLDWNVGRVMAFLRESGLSENTHIVFFSDHGDLHGSHGQFHKTSPLEESIRIPFIVGGAQVHEKKWMRRQQSQALLNHVDIAPTSLGLCGLPVPDWMEGKDLSAPRFRWDAADEGPDSAYLQCVVPTGHGDSVNRAWRGIVTNDGWKYVCSEGAPWLMFNLNEDPYEQANHAFNTVYRNEHNRLLERLRRWVKETDDDFPLPDNI